MDDGKIVIGETYYLADESTAEVQEKDASRAYCFVRYPGGMTAYRWIQFDKLIRRVSDEDETD